MHQKYPAQILFVAWRGVIANEKLEEVKVMLRQAEEKCDVLDREMQEAMVRLTVVSMISSDSFWRPGTNSSRRGGGSRPGNAAGKPARHGSAAGQATAGSDGGGRRSSRLTRRE